MPVAVTTGAPNATQTPDGWNVVRLGEVCSRPQYGANAPAIPFDEALPRYVRVTDITDDGHLRSSDPRSADPMKTAGYELREGDLLFARSGSVGRTYLHRSGRGPCVFAGYLIRFRALSDVALPEFLERWTRSQFFMRWVRSMQRAGAQPNINATEYSSLPVLLPPLSEQRAIAAVLDSIDEAIERADEAIAATEHLRDALLHELLTRGLPGQHSEWQQVPGLGTIPAAWDAVPLRAVLILNQPGAWGDEASPDGELVRVLRAADLTRDGRVNTDGAAWRCLSPRDRTRRLMQDGDLMLERSGGGPGAPVGRVALIGRMGPVYCNNFCQQLRVDHDRLSPHYTLRALWHRYMRGVTARLEHQTTGIRNLDYDGYLSFPIPLPPLPEQRAIASVLDSVDVAIERAREERCDLRSLQASTSEALLTGRVRVDQRK